MEYAVSLQFLRHPSINVKVDSCFCLSKLLLRYVPVSLRSLLNLVCMLCNINELCTIFCFLSFGSHCVIFGSKERFLKGFFCCMDLWQPLTLTCQLSWRIKDPRLTSQLLDIVIPQTISSPLLIVPVAGVGITAIVECEPLLGLILQDLVQAWVCMWY